ncbi:hypothetical protein STEG23_036216, partial [Scotinomys teguina]
MAAKLSVLSKLIISGAPLDLSFLSAFTLSPKWDVFIKPFPFLLYCLKLQRPEKDVGSPGVEGLRTVLGTELESSGRAPEKCLPDDQFEQPQFVCQIFFHGNYDPQLLKIASVGEGVEQEEHCSTVGGNANWHNHSGNQYGEFSENWESLFLKTQLYHSLCMPIKGLGFVLGAYQCICKAGFYHPRVFSVNNFQKQLCKYVILNFMTCCDLFSYTLKLQLHSGYTPVTLRLHSGYTPVTLHSGYTPVTLHSGYTQ